MKEHTWERRGEEIAHIYKAYAPKHNGGVKEDEEGYLLN